MVRSRRISFVRPIMLGKDLIKRAALKRRLAARIRRSYFVRFHMVLILSATVISGVICSKLLSLLGVSRMPVRYGIAIIVSYLLFFLFVKLWLLYIGIGRRAMMKKDKGKGGSGWGDLIPSFRGSGSGSGAPRLFTGFRGGASGGGGAGEAFAESNPSVAVPVGMGSNPVVAEGAHGGGGGILDGLSGVGDEGFLKLLAILLLVVLVFSVVIVGAYLIWCAPIILSDAAFHVLLAANLSRKVRRVKESNWEMSILGATWWGFLLILLAAIAFGIVAQLYNPAAVTVRDLFASAR
jgi:hypothetical protein